MAYPMRKVAKFKIMSRQIALYNNNNDDGWHSLFFDKRSSSEGVDILDCAVTSAGRTARSCAGLTIDRQVGDSTSTYLELGFHVGRFSRWS
jgi:hypothetical protein